MTDVKKTNLELVGLAIAILGGIIGIAGGVGAFYILPYRVEAMEHKLETVVVRHDNDHELLLRIEERLINVQKELTQRK
jgi:ABC-type lipoprotein release transport system permease subunit